MVKKTIILLVLYFLQFYMSSLSGENISSYLTNSREPEPHVFCPLEPEPLEKIPGAEPAWEKNREPERQGKNI